MLPCCLITPNRCGKNKSCSSTAAMSTVTYARGFTKYQDPVLPWKYQNTFMEVLKYSRISTVII